MVFEHLFPESLLERKEWSAFFLAIIYSTISIIIARLLFPANSGIVSVVFLSIFLIPYFETILARDEQEELHEKEPKFLGILKDNWRAIQIYFFLFIGIYVAYMLYAFIAPYFGFNIGTVFREQLSLESLRGGASFSFTTFNEILYNNWWVLLACFLVALIAGDGAVFFVAWNASTWGTIFGYRAVMASAQTGQSALWLLLIIVVITLPHLILEGGAYILSALAGGIISDEVDDRDELRRFVLYFITAIMVYGIAMMVFTFTFLPMHKMLYEVAVIATALGILYCMHYVFVEVHHSKAFRYNFYIFLMAIGLFIIGALVETLVLFNAKPLQDVYMAAMLAGMR